MTRNTLAQLKLGSCWPETTIACRASLQIVNLFSGLRALHRLFLGLFLGCGGFFSLVQSRLVHHGTGIAETGIKEGLAARVDQGTADSTPLCHLIADQGENTASTTTGERRQAVDTAIIVINVLCNFLVGETGATPGPKAAANVIAALAGSLFPVI